MAMWDKVKQELDRAGKVAQDALDEGKIRLEVFRARQRADTSAQQLGYALFRARQSGQEVDAETYGRLSGELASHEAEITRLEAQIASASAARRGEKA